MGRPPSISRKPELPCSAAQLHTLRQPSRSTQAAAEQPLSWAAAGGRACSLGQARRGFCTGWMSGQGGSEAVADPVRGMRSRSPM